MDAHKNFAVSTVATAPSPAASGTSLVVASGHGARFPAAPFNATVWPANAQPTVDNAEIVRVTAKSTDTLTITRSQEGTSARTIVVGDQIAATITAKTLEDLETVAISARIERTTDQTGIVSGTLTVVVFESERYDHGGLADLGSDSDELTVPVGGAGVYMISGGVLWEANATGKRTLFITVNGSGVAETSAAAGSGNPASGVTTQWDLADGDKIGLRVQQDSGANRSLLGTAGPRIHLEAVRIHV